MYSRPSEYAARPRPNTHIGLDEDRPLKSIGLPYYTTPQLSVFPNTPIPAHQPPAFIPSEILSSMKLIDFVDYARNRGTFKRNQRQKADADLRDSTSRHSNNMSRNTNDENNRDSLLPGNDPDKVPKVYRLVKVKYSK
ncbi:hypothetical protein SeLEV6574_g00489 [Synchytrium endobioticum]|uniref:Uncharacterized protein n=1 Tax=Synchytrium endobioticum TaxID=286115 RepID=A0A507DHP6_9FUNG|nr:hypothetical protein SeLEV6574_g00489 [Synchytrium endobioticum]